MFEGDTISYADTDDDKTLFPFKKFAVDSEGGVSILILPSENVEGDIVIDCGYTKLFKNMNEDDSAYRYFLNIAAWSARSQYHIIIENIDVIKWRPNAIEYKIDENKKWNQFMKKDNIINKNIDLSKMSTFFAFDNSSSINDIKELYFKIIKEIIETYKEGDAFFLWGSNIKQKTKEEIEQWIINKDCPGGTYPYCIVEESNKHNELRGHLIIVTDGCVSEKKILKCDELMQKYNIKFKYVTIYVIENNGKGNMSVGAPFCRDSPNKTIHVINEKKREIFETYSLNDLDIFNKIKNINIYKEFNEKYESLRKVIKAKVLGKNGDTTIKEDLNNLEERIKNTVNNENKNDFFNKINLLKDYANKGVHDFKFGTAGIKE